MRPTRLLSAAALAAALAFAVPAGATTITPFAAAMAAAIADGDADGAVAAFYRERDFAPVWSGEGAEARRAAFLSALARTPLHALPARGLTVDGLRAEFAAAATPAARAELDVAMTRRFLRLAHDISSGVLDPKTVDRTLVLEVPRRDEAALLDAWAGGDPAAVMHDLWPATPRYARLLREKLRLEEMAARGGWGPEVPGGRLVPGASGAAVVALRDRLVRMGYAERSATATYDDALTEAVRAFQGDHGLAADGVAGTGTIRALNVPVTRRLQQVAVGLERQRWMNKPLEPRHILVNLAEQHAYVVDDGKVTFDTVVVVGHPDADRRTPEFSHTMTHMVVNPTWHVPRSITVNEYLPALRRGGARHLRIYRNGREVSRSSINFSRYTARNFPYSLKQPPGNGNALGRVKFMFPNPWNIYLHDTQAKSLFGRDVRAFSHGCVRVGDPFGLAYHLLAPQEADSRAFFDGILRTRRERRVDIAAPVGVHLVHWSAWVDAEGRAQYRGDVYGRDAAILEALRAAGVETAARRS
ncbi:L,D-transpeptidase family protein [Jannaschia sp. Os4]|uniref:L,D-transpeptidase family protein n=1 Tax=Jannaschia sp. Os4 TaxID=2807617 RepID=UPI00193A968A|nr:L,D-transpeptidase family protein [Jannaschia sp. Os4]MBM2577030.1 L,D-transpeptidase family protein [Jannaschia sp. Os4]